jgi:hypothetical protein
LPTTERAFIHKHRTKGREAGETHRNYCVYRGALDGKMIGDAFKVKKTSENIRN